MRFKNKKIIITGASKNIGAGIAIKLAEEGAEIVLGYNKDKKGAIRTQEKLSK